MIRLLTVGDNVVDCYPDLGTMFPGGNTVNVAVHAQRNGAEAAYLGALGTDAVSTCSCQVLNHHSSTT